MVMRRWDPIRDLLTLQERMNRLFEDSLARGRPDTGSAAWTPLADVYETPDGFVAHVELPGVAEKDVEVVVEGDRVLVRGERRQMGHARPESYHRMERSYGAFARAFRLSAEIQAESVVTEFRDGVLRLELPKTRERASWRARERRE